MNKTETKDTKHDGTRNSYCWRKTTKIDMVSIFLN